MCSSANAAGTRLAVLRAADANVKANERPIPISALGVHLRRQNLRLGNLRRLRQQSSALANSALAISPFRCALRPFSSAKVSKMPYFPGPILIAYHVIVPASASASGCADFKKLFHFFFFPRFRFQLGPNRKFAHDLYSSSASDARTTHLVKAIVFASAATRRGGRSAPVHPL